MRLNKKTLRGMRNLRCSHSLMLVFLFFSATSLAQQSANLEQIKRVALSSIDDGQKTQRQIDAIDDKRLKLVNDYRVSLKQNENLTKYNEILRQTIKSLQASALSLQQQIESISNLERDIVPLISEMLNGLEKFIELDVPFLLEERHARIQDLRALMHDGNISNSEKYRRILEAYQIENDYGRTIEAYEDKLTTGGKVDEAQIVTFLKVGRLVYLYQTQDRSQSYRWSAVENKWLRLNDSYNAQIDEGIKMAKAQIPSNLLFIPVETLL